MIFFWRGYGFLVPVIWIAVLLIVSGMVGEGYYEHHDGRNFLLVLSRQWLSVGRAQN